MEMEAALAAADALNIDDASCAVTHFCANIHETVFFAWTRYFAKSLNAYLLYIHTCMLLQHTGDRGIASKCNCLNTVGAFWAWFGLQ